MLHLILMTLSGKFEKLIEFELETMAEVRATVEQHAASGGYTNVKPVEDVDSIRFTARTPGGRGGRNIAYVDFYE
jgi:hypothetical protein